MSESAEEAEFPGRRFAFWLCAAVVAGFAAVVACASFDRGRTAELETVEQVSAAGDGRFFKLPGTVLKQPVVSLGAQPLVLAENKTHGFSDAEMIRAGTDAASGLTIYAAREMPKKGGRAEPVEGAFFLKTAPGEFVRLRAVK